MKNILLSVFILLFVSSCGQNKDERTTLAADNHLEVLEVNAIPSNSLLHIFGDTLVGMTIVDERATSPYRKYGFEFMGHCYACDLASIIITPNYLLLENTCQTGVKREYYYQMIENSRDRFVIVAEKISFIFEQIDEAPIYKLTFKGVFEKHNELRIIEYYTTKTALPKFEICDCGDFDG